MAGNRCPLRAVSGSQRWRVQPHARWLRPGRGTLGHATRACDARRGSGASHRRCPTCGQGSHRPRSAAPPRPARGTAEFDEADRASARTAPPAQFCITAVLLILYRKDILDLLWLEHVFNSNVEHSERHVQRGTWIGGKAASRGKEQGNDPGCRHT